MKLTVISEKGIVLQVTVESITLPSVEGAFTVLPHHAPTIAELSAGKIEYATAGAQKKSIEITGGFTEVSGEGAVVFAETQQQK